MNVFSGKSSSSIRVKRFFLFSFDVAINLLIFIAEIKSFLSLCHGIVFSLIQMLQVSRALTMLNPLQVPILNNDRNACTLTHFHHSTLFLELGQ